MALTVGVVSTFPASYQAGLGTDSDSADWGNLSCGGLDDTI